MKEKFQTMSERDKMLLVLLLFVAILAGLFSLNTSIQTKQEELIIENEGLKNQETLVKESTMDIADTEVEIETKFEKIKELYTKVPDNIESPIDFETMFLEWIKGRNVRVDTFTYGKPETVRVEFGSENEQIDIEEDKLGSVAGQLDGMEGSGDVDYSEETPSETPETPEDTGEAVETPSETSVPSIMAASFNYKLELSRYEYTRLLDKISQMSEFYQLQSTEFSVSDEGVGSGVLSVRVYSFDKPERFKEKTNNNNNIEEPSN